MMYFNPALLHKVAVGQPSSMDMAWGDPTFQVWLDKNYVHNDSSFNHNPPQDVKEEYLRLYKESQKAEQLKRLNEYRKKKGQPPIDRLPGQQPPDLKPRLPTDNMGRPQSKELPQGQGQGNTQGQGQGNGQGQTNTTDTPAEGEGKNIFGLTNLPDDYDMSKGFKDVQDWWNGSGDAASAAGSRALAYFAPKLVGAVGLGAVASMLAGRKGGVMMPLLGAIGGFLAGGPLMDLINKMFGPTKTTEQVKKEEEEKKNNPNGSTTDNGGTTANNGNADNGGGTANNSGGTPPAGSTPGANGQGGQGANGTNAGTYDTEASAEEEAMRGAIPGNQGGQGDGTGASANGQGGTPPTNGTASGTGAQPGAGGTPPANGGTPPANGNGNGNGATINSGNFDENGEYIATEEDVAAYEAIANSTGDQYTPAQKESCRKLAEQWKQQIAARKAKQAQGQTPAPGTPAPGTPATPATPAAPKPGAPAPTNNAGGYRQIKTGNPAIDNIFKNPLDNILPGRTQPGNTGKNPLERPQVGPLRQPEAPGAPKPPVAPKPTPPIGPKPGAAPGVKPPKQPGI